jgi:hypothetical protein
MGDTTGIRTSDERRRFPRRVGETLVRFEGDNFSIYSRATDVSERGAFVATHYLLMPGEEIELHLIDSAGGEAATRARVVRTISKKPERGEAVIGFGVEFVDDPTAVP